MKICSIDDCDSRVAARGWCTKHWTRWRTTGDPLKTKSTPKGEAKRFLEEIVIPYQGDDCLKWPYSTRGNGYGQTGPRTKRLLVHRVVCEAVYGPPPTPEHQAAHSCGKGRQGCVNPKHLRWATREENERDKIEHGTVMRGEKNGFSKLTEDQIHQILSLKGSQSQRKIASQFDISQCHVWRIHNNAAWKHLQLTI